MKSIKALAAFVLGVMEMRGSKGLLVLFLLGAVALGLGTPGWAAQFEEARIFIEYNQTANDLGFHVSLDGEDWKTLKISGPTGMIFGITTKGGFNTFGLTELFFEGAEPSLDEVPLEDLLALFPEGQYKFVGVTVGGGSLVSKATFTHNVPDGPVVSTKVDDDEVVISWEEVTGPAPILPDGDIEIVGYQVIVGSFQVTLPADSRSVTLPEEFVESLGPGVHGGEVLSIEAGGNQTITAFSFTTE